MRRVLVGLTDMMGGLEVMTELEDLPAQAVSDIKLALGQLRAARTNLIKVAKLLRATEQEEGVSIESAIN